MERSGTLVAGQTKEAAVLRKAANRKKRTKLSIFFLLALVYSLAHTKAGARSGDAGNTDFPLGFYCVGCAVAKMLSIP